MHGINLLFSTKPKPFSNICSFSGLSPSSPGVDENICNLCWKTLVFIWSPDTRHAINFMLGSCGCSFLLKGKYRESLLFGSFTGGLINSLNNLGNYGWVVKAGTIITPLHTHFPFFVKSGELNKKEGMRGSFPYSSYIRKHQYLQLQVQDYKSNTIYIYCLFWWQKRSIVNSPNSLLWVSKYFALRLHSRLSLIFQDSLSPTLFFFDSM